MEVLIFILGVVAGAMAHWGVSVSSRMRLADERRDQKQEMERLREARQAHRAREDALSSREEMLRQEMHAFQVTAAAHARGVINYGELQTENRGLKKDLQNTAVQVRKLERDREIAREARDGLAAAYLEEIGRSIATSLTTNNFVTCKHRLVEAIDGMNTWGWQVPEEKAKALEIDLKRSYEGAVRAAYQREEQARIKARIREEAVLEREVEREKREVEKFRRLLDAALEKSKDEHAIEVQYYRDELAKAEEKANRAIAQAQLTKAGHVYVISNVGSFGDGVYKIGMTRRLEPQERVDELSSASVPFPFDVHMMISSTDAPRLENALHRALWKCRVNKARPRKEFFKASFDEILTIVRQYHGQVEFVAEPPAAEYRESLEATDEDMEFQERVYGALPGEEEVAFEDEE